MHQSKLSRRARTIALVVLFGFFSAMAMARAPDSQLLDTPDIKLLHDGDVRAVAYLPDGSLIVGGYFGYINGQPRRNLARILPNGEVDPDWRPEPDRSVTALAVDAAGNIYVGGNFFEIGGQVHYYISRILAGTGGQVDPLWPASLYTLGGYPKRLLVSADGSAIYAAMPGTVRKISSSGVLATEWGMQLRGDVYDIALGGDGNLYVAGSSLFPVAGQWRLLRMSADGVGEVDTTWNPQPSDRVDTLSVDQSTHSLIVGGAFTQIGGQEQANLARIPFASNGAIDTAWRPQAGGRVGRLSNVADGKVFAFIYPVSLPVTFQPGLRKFDVASGTVDPDWQHDVTGFGIPPMEVASGYPLAVGGWFMSVAGIASYNLALLPASGNSVLPTFEVGYPGTVVAIARQPDGGTILGGMFNWAGGKPRSNLLRLKPDGTLDPLWDPSPDIDIGALEVDAEGDVFVGGYFNSIGGQVQNGMARISGSGAGLAQPFPALGRADVLRYDGHGNLYVGGDLALEQGGPHRSLVKIVRSGSGDWQVDSAWVPQTGTVSDLILDASRNLYAAVGENGFRGVRRISADGSGQVDPQWAFPVAGLAYSLALDASHRLYVGGDFVLGEGFAQTNLVRIETGAAAVVDAQWSPLVTGPVSAIAIGADGSVYAGQGSIREAGVPHTYLSRFAGTGAGLIDSSWFTDIVNPGWGYVSDILVEPNNRILVAGNFVVGNPATRMSLVAYGDAIFAGGFGVPPAD